MALALTSLGHFVNDGTTMFIPVVAAIVATEKAVPILTVTLMSIAFYASSSLFAVFVGRWADTRGSHATMIGIGLSLLSTSLLGFFVSIALTAGSLLATLAVVSSIIAGFGSAFYHPLAATVIQGIFLAKSKGKALGVNGAAGGLGATTYPVLFFFAAILLSRGGAFILLALIGFAASLVIPLGLSGRTMMQRVRNGEESSKAREALTRGIVILTVVTAVRSISAAGISFWLPTYISTQKGAGIGTLLGLTLGVMYATAIIGQLLFGVLVDRFDKRLILGIGSGGSALSTLGYIFSSGTIEFLFIALFGLFTFSIFPTLLALASEYVPDTSASLANSLVWGLGITGGSVIGPLVVGVIVGNNLPDLNIAFELMVVTGMIGALVTPLMPRPVRAERPVLLS